MLRIHTPRRENGGGGRRSLVSIVPRFRGLFRYIYYTPAPWRCQVFAGAEFPPVFNLVSPSSLTLTQW